MSLNTQNNLNKSQSAQARAIERLSSGMRINSAKDDAAGQAIANRFTTNVKGLTQAARNANDGISMAQTAEGAVDEINNNLQRIRELTVQAKTGSNSESDIKSLQEEVAQRLEEIDRISAQTDFNGNKVLSKDGAMKIQIGALDNQTISLDFKKIDSSVLKVDSLDLSNKGQIGNQVKKLSDTEVAGTAAITYKEDTSRTNEKLFITGTAGTFTLEFEDAGGTKKYYTVDASNFTADGKVDIAGLTAATAKPTSTTTTEIADGDVAIASTTKAAIQLGPNQELFQKLEADGNVSADKFLIKKDDKYFEVSRSDFDDGTGVIKFTSAAKLDPAVAITTDIHDAPLAALDDALKTVDSMRSTLFYIRCSTKSYGIYGEQS